MRSPQKSNKDHKETVVKLINEKEDYSYERQILCHTLGGLQCPILTITALPNKKYPMRKR